MTSTTFLISLLALCCIVVQSEETIRLSLPVFRLELTIKIQEPFRRSLYGNLRRGLSPLSSQLETGTGLQISAGEESSSVQSGVVEEINSRELQTTTSDKIDAAIQSTAEQHLKNIYSEQFDMEPTQVLLTVVTNTPSTTSSQTNNKDEDLVEYEEVSTNGIYVRSSFLGGVVTFPVNNNESGEGGDVSLPTRSELQSVTLDAFSIPGKGEIFLQNLKGYSPTISQLNPGLLLISASEVKRNDIADSNAADLATTSNNYYNGEGSAPAITPANTNNNNGGNDMNIWAVAAVAALGAMFLVIVTCTSILYCDWRKRKERRERRRERAFIMQQQQQQGMMGAVYNSGGSNYALSNDGKNSKNYTNMEIDGDGVAQQQQQLQIVVPHASSGDTEEYDGISPSTQGSNNIINNNNNDRDGMNMEKKGSLLGNIVNKSRRSLIKSKAAKEQLQEANNTSSPTSQPLSAQGEYQPNDYNNNMNNHMNNNPAADMSVTDCGYSVGEDTTMLYPTINRNRANSKDNMSDWDGYSMDGMSAIGDGGVSQYGGSGKGGGSGVHSKNKGGESRDMYYNGDVPRDFDSVWGDDESKLTMDGTDVNSVDYDNGAARAALMAAADGDSVSDYNMPPVIATASRNNNADLADLTQNLNQLVDQELGVTDVSVEKSNTSTSSAGKLDEFIDSDSASGSGHNFTLELLGKKSKSKLTKGTSAGSSSVTPSVDDDDSILGDLYKDDTMSELGGGLGGDDISAIGGVAEEEGDEDDEGTADDGKNISSGDSVDSTPSWAEKIQSAVGNSAIVSNIFRSSSKGMLDNDEEGGDKQMDTPAPSKDEEDQDGGESSSSSQAQRIKNKFMSGLISDDSSVGSSRSNRSRNSTSSKGSRGSHKSSSSRKANTAKSSSEKALGLTNSMDEEVDEDPAAMIDNINSMLSECRDILDTEKDTAGEP